MHCRPNFSLCAARARVIGLYSLRHCIDHGAFVPLAVARCAQLCRLPTSQVGVIVILYTVVSDARHSKSRPRPIAGCCHLANLTA